ncbi:MAG TPA: PfkB family carbohydrate kinase [Kofleriaceae bacterium]|nr:PfkB family carbohydrate kinase [Kofleriaceae bacterium]
MRVAVVGHLEWVELVRVDEVPRAGDIVQAVPLLALAAGGGGVAAVQLARWGAESLFFTAFGGDALGARARAELASRGVTLHAATRAEPQRRAVTLVDAVRERTIIVIGDRHVASGADPLPWDTLASCDAVYVTGGDVEAVRAARAARVVVATSRVLPLLRASGIAIDALVGSSNDPTEHYVPGDLPVAPGLVIRTNGAAGGTYELAGQTYAYPAVPAVMTGDSYGAGDTFAAGVTFALGEGRGAADAIAFAAARAAEVLAFTGPFPP